MDDAEVIETMMEAARPASWEEIRRAIGVIYLRGLSPFDRYSYRGEEVNPITFMIPKSAVRLCQMYEERILNPSYWYVRFYTMLDIVLDYIAKTCLDDPILCYPNIKTAVFINRCFWHQHQECKKATLPSKNAEFWREKLCGNRERDERNIAALEQRGWRVAIIWQCSIKQGVQDLIAMLEWEKSK